MGTLGSDLRIGVRTIFCKPGFSLAVVLMLALGIGTTTAIFSVFDAVLLTPLPYPDADRLVQVWEFDPNQGGRNTVSPLNWADWRERSGSFESIAVYEYDPLTLTGEGEARRIVASRVSADFFGLLGVQPETGRPLRPEEDRPGSNRVVVLSHRLWRDSFGADPALVGRTITLDGQGFTVVGVMPAAFAYPNSAVELWTPIALDLPSYNRGSHFLFSIGRLKSGVTVERAQAEMDTIAAQLTRDYPGTNAESGVELVTLHEQTVGESRPALLLLLGAVTLVLLVSCTNVINLMLARGSTRGKEIAVRSALGASRLQIARQFFTESLILALVAGGLGALLARWGVDLFLWIGGSGIPRRHEIGVDLGVLAFTLGVSIATGLLCGLVPAAQASRRDVGDALKEAGRGASAGRGRRRLHGALVVAEVSLALLLLVAGGLLARSFLHLRKVDPGFEAAGLLTFHISLPPSKYAEAHRQAEFFRTVLERVGTTPGVRHVGATRGLPFAGSRSRTSFEIVGRPDDPSGPSRNTDTRLASEGLFETMGIPLIRGRALEAGDDAGSPAVVVINEAMAGLFWPDDDPIGRRISTGFPPMESEIVGIVGDTMHETLHEPAAHSIYVPFRQRPHYKMSFVVRTAGPPLEQVAAIRSAIRAVDPDQPIYGVTSMDERLDRSISAERFSMSLLVAFAASALVLALMGVYGVLSFAVNERRHEMGVRIALGATRRDVLRLVVSAGFRLCLTGVAIGLFGAFALSRLLAGMLFGVTATDPTVLVATSLGLIATGVLASTVPALRAASVDPNDALRCE